MKLARSGLAACALALTLAAPHAHAQSVLNPGVGGGGNPRVLPPGSMPYGQSYSAWLADSWRYVLSLPAPVNPLLEPTGELCMIGQSGPVVFIQAPTCTGGGFPCVEVASKSCTIPAGKGIFLPVLGAISSVATGHGTTEAELNGFIDFALGLIAGVSIEIDGVPIQNPMQYIARSGLFTWGPLPDDNLLEFLGFGTPAGTTSDAVTGGLGLMLAPLTPGEHVIHYTGAFTGFLEEDITWTLNVVEDGLSTTGSGALDAAATPAPAERGTWGRLKVIYR